MSGQMEERAVCGAIVCIDALETDEGRAAVLDHLVERMGREEIIARLAKPSCDAAPREETAQEKIIKEAGGIFVVPAGVEVPPIPEKYSIEFLESKHPLREGSIAGHVILGFDDESKQWVCIDRGSGGQSDIVPGSLGPDGRGLPGNKQDDIIAGKEVGGVKLTSPDDYEPNKRVIDAAIVQHLNEGKSVQELPFYGIWGRTADTGHAAAGCRVLLGLSSGLGTDVRDFYHSDRALGNVGLLAVWN